MVQKLAALVGLGSVTSVVLLYRCLKMFADFQALAVQL